MFFDFLSRLFDFRKRHTHEIHELIAIPVQRMLALLQSLDGVRDTGLRQKLFYSNLSDSLKVALKLSGMLTPSDDERVLTSEPAEVLVRFLFERSLVVRFLATLSGEEPLNRFNKTADESMAQKWPASHKRHHEELNSAQLPPYKQMADMIDPSGNAALLYQRLSHLAHPRTSFPYSVAEATARKNLGISATDYFIMRRDNFVPIAVDALNQICDACEKELRVSTSL
jgi:hypothetical protein